MCYYKVNRAANYINKLQNNWKALLKYCIYLNDKYITAYLRYMAILLLTFLSQGVPWLEYYKKMNYTFFKVKQKLKFTSTKKNKYIVQI